jgi:hypothetical protein
LIDPFLKEDHGSDAEDSDQGITLYILDGGAHDLNHDFETSDCISRIRHWILMSAKKNGK